MTEVALATTEKEITMDQNETEERIHSVEVAQATQTATLAGAQATQATQAAAQAGTTATNAAMHAGLLGTMAAGSVSLIVGIFLGFAIRRARD